MLGKRKRDTQIVPRRRNSHNELFASTSANADAASILRHHFETTFAPLSDLATEQSSDELSDDTDNNSDSDQESDAATEVSDWSGLSGSDNEVPIVEVVDHTISLNGADHADDEEYRARQKAFMVRLFNMLRHRYILPQRFETALLHARLVVANLYDL